MGKWSIPSNVLNYVQHNRFHSMNHTLDIKVVNKYKYKPNTEEKVFKELDFVATPQNYKRSTWTYKGIHSKIVSSNRFEENSDLSTMYLG